MDNLWRKEQAGRKDAIEVLSDERIGEILANRRVVDTGDPKLDATMEKAHDEVDELLRNYRDHQSKGDPIQNPTPAKLEKAPTPVLTVVSSLPATSSSSIEFTSVIETLEAKLAELKTLAEPIRKELVPIEAQIAEYTAAIKRLQS